jgi:hypothetical protein
MCADSAPDQLGHSLKDTGYPPPYLPSIGRIVGAKSCRKTLLIAQHTTMKPYSASDE